MMDVRTRRGWSGLAARGESPAAFERRCIPKLPALGHLLQESNTAGIESASELDGLTVCPEEGDDP